jgi:hypothetical protein
VRTASATTSGKPTARRRFVTARTTIEPLLPSSSWLDP